jgi:hypothetical protein
MEPECPSPYLQNPTSGPFAEPVESSPHPLWSP